MGVLSQVGVGRLTRALKAYNLPVSLSDPRIANLSAAKSLTIDRLMDVMRIDKKNSGPQKKVVILSKIGATYEQKATVVEDDIITKTLAEAVEVVPGIPTKSPVTMATPGSKSISNRALVLAALAKGTCRLKNLLHSDDTQVMMAALNELKVRSSVTTLTLSSYGLEIGSLIRLGRWRGHTRRHRRRRSSFCSTQGQGNLPRQCRNRCSVPHHRLHSSAAIFLRRCGNDYHHRKRSHEATPNRSPRLCSQS